MYILRLLSRAEEQEEVSNSNRMKPFTISDGTTADVIGDLPEQVTIEASSNPGTLGEEY